MEGPEERLVAARLKPVSTSLDVVIPVLNEEKALAASVSAVSKFLSAEFSDLHWRIRIADNGSTDSTPEIAKGLAAGDRRVHYLRLEQRGRGGALKKAWLDSDADVLSYMDVDLSTELGALPQLVSAIVDAGYDLAIGSRLLGGAAVEDRPKHRTVISKTYNAIVHGLFRTSFKDAQCGFKAVSRRAADELVQVVVDSGWFFDSELLILAEKNGYRIKEVPVAWRDDPDSRVRIVPTAYDDLKGLLRLRLGGLKRASAILAASHRS